MLAKAMQRMACGRRSLLHFSTCRVDPADYELTRAVTDRAGYAHSTQLLTSGGTDTTSSNMDGVRGRAK